jgi:uncharacterized Zn finger protein
MQLNFFEEDVSPVILERGEDYYHDNAVCDLQETEPGQWLAIVEGSEVYEVDVSIEDNEVIDFYCSCPFEGHICKHVVAVLMAIRDDETGRTPKMTNDEWKKVLSQIPVQELRLFVEEYAKEDKEFRNRFMLYFSEYTSNKKDSKYKDLVAKSLQLAGDRFGFINYYQMHKAIKPLSSLINKAHAYIEKQEYEEAFGIAAGIAPQCIDIMEFVDDSDGELGETIDDAFEIVSQVLNKSKDENKNAEIYDWVLEQAANKNYNDYGCESILESLIVDGANTPGLIHKAHEFIDHQIKEFSKDDSFFGEFNIKKYLKFKMELYKKTGEDENTQEILQNNDRIKEFREIMVDQLLEKGEDQNAIEMIMEGIQIAEEDKRTGIVRDWKEKLLSVYMQRNDIPNIKKYALELFLENNNMEHYRIYKNQFSKNEWKEQREKIINQLIIKHKKEFKKFSKGNIENISFKDNNENESFYSFTYSHKIANVFIEEKLWDKLLKMVEQNPKIEIVAKNTKYLKDSYPNELIEMYKKVIYDYSDKNTGRDAYIRIADMLKLLTKVKNGKEAAKIIMENLLKNYPKRTAMKDELNKLQKHIN